MVPDVAVSASKEGIGASSVSNEGSWNVQRKEPTAGCEMAKRELSQLPSEICEDKIGGSRWEFFRFLFALILHPRRT